ncbi:Elongator subunit elp2 [Massospora cicadina]|nr:Elongator subunit elp2 [Massospora cicadina]
MSTWAEVEFTSVGCNGIANCMDYLRYPPPSLAAAKPDCGVGALDVGWVIFGANVGVGLVKVAEPGEMASKSGTLVPCKAAPNVQILKWHTSRVNAVAWIYDAQDRPCGILSGDMDGNGAIFTPTKDGVTPGPEGWVGCDWNVNATFSGHAGAIVALSAPKPSYASRHEGNVVVSCGIDGTIRVWVWINGVISLAQTISHRASYALSVSVAYLPLERPKLILAVGNTDCKVRLFIEASDEHTFELAATLEGHEDWLRSVAFGSPDGGSLTLASAGQDRSIRVWKLAPLGVENKAEGLAEVMARMGLGTRAHAFQVGPETRWSVMLDALLVGHDDWVYSVSWHPPQVPGQQPARLVSASADKSLMVWSPDPDTGIWVNETQLGEIGGSTLGFYGGAFSPSGRALLALGYKGALHLWHADSPGAWVAQPFSSGHIGPVTSLSWDPTAAYLITTSHDQTARAFAPCLGWGWREISRSQIHGYDLRRAAFIRPYQYVCAAEEKVLRIMDAPQPFLERLRALTGHVASMDPSRHHQPSAKLPALGLSNKAAPAQEAAQAPTVSRPPYEEELLQATLWPELDKLYGHGYEVVAVAAAPDASVIASSAKATAPEHAAIRLFETVGFKSVGVLAAHHLTVTCLAFSPTSTLLVSGSRDRSWTLFSRDPQSHFRLLFNVPKAHARIIWDIKFANDSRHILTGSRDKSVKVWKLADSGAEVVSTLQFPSPVTALAVAPALDHNVTACCFAVGLEDGGVGVGRGFRACWEMVCWIPTSVTPSKPIDALAFQPSVTGAASSHVLRLATASDDHSLRIYRQKFASLEGHPLRTGKGNKPEMGEDGKVWDRGKLKRTYLGAACIA